MRGTILITYTSGSLALPANSKGPAGFALSTSVGAIDQLEWVYDGTDFLFTLPGVSLQPPYRPETLAYIAAVGMTNNAHKLAFNTFIQGLVDDVIWGKFYAIWPFYGPAGSETANTHKIDLKATYTGAFSAGVTYNNLGVTSNGTTGWFDSNFNFAMVGAVNSAAAYVYCRTTTLSYNTTLFAGGGAGHTNFGLATTGAGVIAAGTNSNLSTPGVDAGSDWSKHFVVQRTDSATATIYADASSVNNSHASTTANQDDIFFLGGNYDGGGYVSTSDVINLGLAAVGEGMTAGQWTAFRARVDALMTALGRPN